MPPALHKDFAMTTARVSTKGQITIPARIRQLLQLGAGDRIEFVEIEAGRFEVFAATRSVQELKGMFGKTVARKGRVTLADMQRAVTR
jgi:antitoxin PrlF